jgi:hypothetical protein
VGEKRRMEGITSETFYFSFKQKICQIIQNTENYNNAILYSTRKRRIAKNGNDGYVFDIEKLKKYLDLDSLLIEDEDE